MVLLTAHAVRTCTGQFYVILDQKAPPFAQKRDLASKVKKAADHDARVELLLDCADEGIGDKLKAFEGEQATGEKLNELSEKYFRKHPRSFDAPWPSEEPLDRELRQFMTSMVDERPDVVKAKAKELLGVELD